MDQSSEVRNVENELTHSTSASKLKIPNDMPIYSVKEMSGLDQSQIYIKTEPEENESEFPVMPCTSTQMYPNDVKTETKEAMIKLGLENIKNEIIEDSLDVSRETKANTHLQININLGESRIKIEPTEDEEHIFFGKHFLDTEKYPDIHSSKIKVTDKEIEEHLPSDPENIMKYKTEADEKEICIQNSDEQPNSPENKGSKKKKQLLKRNKQIRPRKHTCNVCDKLFTCKSNLDTHLRIHSGEKPFECKICQKSFTIRSNLDSHMLVHSGEKPYACDVCNEVFRRKLTLSKHKLIHLGVRPYSCSQCNSSFRQKHSLVRHERIHTGDKPYTCDYCEAAYATKSNLDRHKRFHTGEKPYSCNICNKTFVDKSSLNKHRKTHKN